MAACLYNLVINVLLQYSYKDIAATLFELAGASTCSAKVRRKIYKFVKV